MRNIYVVFIFIGVLILIDLYAFKSLRLLLSSTQNSVVKSVVYGMYGLTSVTTYGLLIYVFTNFTRSFNTHVNPYYFFICFGIIILFLIPKLVVGVFHLMDDLVHVFKRMLHFFIQNPGTKDAPGDLLTRWEFITKMGWILAAIPFMSTLYGMLLGRFAFRVVKKKIGFDNLPQSAHGLRIVHISDFHIGSFYKLQNQVQKGFDLINDLNPDIIFFTGDWVNNIYEETLAFEENFKSLKAKYGKFSILGNHDYGDYVSWPDEAIKKENIEKLVAFQRRMGFEVLLNEKFDFETSEGEKIEIIGVENWGEGGFTKYGDLAKAMREADSNNFQILLSHDPSHWEAQVLNKTRIDLTLSGHTHGMQFGVEIPGVIKWSPAQYRYKRWGGLYREGRQHLYVNRGFGYIGFPGRVGMPPEITLIELEKT